MDYTAEAKYREFLEETIREQEDIDRFLAECQIFTEETDINQKLAALNEGLVDNVMDAISKFAQWLKTLWAKFLERLSRIFNSNKGYLNQYRDIILKKAVKEGTINSSNYDVGIKRMAASTIYALTPQDIESFAGMANEDIENTLLQSFSKSAPGIKITTDNMTEAFKAYFLGGKPREMQISQWASNMTNIFNFCYDYDKMTSNLKRCKDTITKSVNGAMDIISKSANASYANPAKPVGAATQESFGYVTEYSVLLEKLEVKRPTNNAEANPAPSRLPNTRGPMGSQSAAQMAAKSVSGVTRNNDQQMKQAGQALGSTAAATSQTANQLGAKIEQIRKCVNFYNKYASAVMTAKLTATERIYKDYMDFIRMHVNDYVGNRAAPEGSVSAKAPTNYATQPKDSQEQPTPAK